MYNLKRVFLYNFFFQEKTMYSTRALAKISLLEGFQNIEIQRWKLQKKCFFVTAGH